MDKNGQKWTEMDRNGQKWTKLKECLKKYISIDNKILNLAGTKRKKS